MVILLTLLLCVGCSDYFDTTKIEFSLIKEGTLQKQFTTDDKMFYFSTPLTGKTGLYVSMVESSDGRVIDMYTRKFDVPPDWQAANMNHAVPPVGKYTLKVFTQKDEKLVGKGDFEVIQGVNK